MKFSRQACTDLSQALRREWLETNGLGGYASSTIVGANTRRYHALLVAAAKPPTQRVVLLSKLEETVHNSQGSFELSTNLYHPDVVHPQGHQFLNGFRLEPFPQFVYELPGTKLVKTVFMVHGKNATVIKYDAVEAAEPFELSVRLLINCRDHHHVTSANPYFRTHPEISPSKLKLSPYEGMPPLFIAHDGNAFVGNGCWYHNFRYPVEAERGLEDREDYFSPGCITKRMRGGDSFVMIASTEPFDAAQATALFEQEYERRKNLLKGWRRWHPLAQTLVEAADKFIVKRDIGHGTRDTVIAGYPWFTDWGRDALISLPGLTLVTGRFEVAREILRTFISHISDGMVPNYFPEAGGEPAYNTVDATLWLFHAVFRYLGYTKDMDFAREVYETLRGVAHWHVKGTRYGISMDTDALLKWDADGVALTWMDAKVGDFIVTPRRGKPVEVNALWFNALMILSHIASALGDAPTQHQSFKLAQVVKESFVEKFWNERLGCLYDCLTDGDANVGAANSRDDSIRPNQIFALSLPFPLLEGERAASVLKVVQEHLLTPFGLRTLSPQHPSYIGRYSGNQRSRDAAYHQGTVWAWLMGPFITAYLQVHGRTRKALDFAKKLLEGFLPHLEDAGLGTVSEIFDGDPPHEPRGCIAQAWSVAELLRAYVEDVRGKIPSPI